MTWLVFLECIINHIQCSIFHKRIKTNETAVWLGSFYPKTRIICLNPDMTVLDLNLDLTFRVFPEHRRNNADQCHSFAFAGYTIHLPGLSRQTHTTRIFISIGVRVEQIAFSRDRAKDLRPFQSFLSSYRDDLDLRIICLSAVCTGVIRKERK